MHDPKLTASVAHHQLLLSDSMMDKLPGGQLAHPHYYLNDHLHQHHRLTKGMTLPRTIIPPSASFSGDVLDIRNQRRLLPLFQRGKDVSVAPDLSYYSRYSSALSDLSAQHRYSDMLYARQLHESVHGDPSALSLPLSITTFSRRVAENHDFLFPGPDPKSGVIIKDISSQPITSSSSTYHLSSSPSKAADSLSLSPLHVSTALSSSSPSSSQSSPSPNRRSSVSPDTRWTDNHQHLSTTVRPSVVSSVSTSGDLPLYLKDDRAVPQDRTLAGVAALPSPLPLHPPLWRSPSYNALYGPGPSPSSSLLGFYPSLASPFDTRANVGHLLDHYLCSPSGLSHHHLHHHLHRHHHFKDSFYNGNAPGFLLDARSSPGKELPSKALKQDRIRDRQEISGVLDADREHSERLNNVKKSASTQTQFSSFSCENLPPPPYYTTHDTIPHDRLHTAAAPIHPYPHHLPPPPPPPPLHQYCHSSQTPLPPLHPSSHPSSSSSYLHHPSSQTHGNRLVINHSIPSPPSAVTPALSSPLASHRRSPPSTSPSLPPYPSSPMSCSPPPPPQYTELTRVHIDVQHAPLNLSLSSALPNPSTTPSSRTSVIANASPSPVGSSDASRSKSEDESEHSRAGPVRNGSSHETAAQVSDEAIEEHFRRSLGNCYSEPSPPKITAVHVSEKISSVDDHFARALGDQMWTEIKARSEPEPLDPLSGSVDDHFAKALGASMWKKLKGETKLVDNGNSTQQEQAQQQQQQMQHQQASQHRSPSSSPLQTPMVS